MPSWGPPRSSVARERQPQAADRARRRRSTAGMPRPSSRWHDEHAWALNSRSEPVAGVGRRRRGHPVLGEEAVADLEQAPFVVGELGAGKRERVAADDLARGVAAELARSMRDRRATTSRDCTGGDAARAATTASRHDRASPSIVRSGDVDLEAERLGGGDDRRRLRLERLDRRRGCWRGPGRCRARPRAGAGRTAPGSPSTAATLAATSPSSCVGEVLVLGRDHVEHAVPATPPG